LRQGFLDEIARSLDEALDTAARHAAERTPRSIAVIANAAAAFPDIVSRGVRIDVVTDQTAAHDPLDGYIPDVPHPAILRINDPDGYIAASRASIARQCEAIVALQRAGAVAFDYGNNLRGEARTAGFADAFSYPGFVPAYIRPLFTQGKGPFRWVALSGDPADIARTDRAVLELFPEDRTLARWIRLAADRVPYQGLPARVCWLGYGERAAFGERIDDLVRRGELRAPIVIGRDHLDSGSVASPNRETEGMLDGSDAIADWPILNALVNTAAGATWVSVHHGGGVGIGNSIHAGMVCVADGSPLGREKLLRVLTTDPGTGVMRHADAGYPDAIAFAREHQIDLP
jgi:urocanate hydratase